MYGTSKKEIFFELSVSAENGVVTFPTAASPSKTSFTLLLGFAVLAEAAVDMSYGLSEAFCRSSLYSYNMINVGNGGD